MNQFKYISVVYTPEQTPSEFWDTNKDTFWIQGPDEVETKLDTIHKELDGTQVATLEGFQDLSRNLLFFTTLQKLPIRCHFDLHVEKTFQGVDATDVDFWNLTRAQKSVLDSANPCVFFTS